MSDVPTEQIGLEDLRALCLAALTRRGADAANAAAIAETIVSAERDHYVSHGAFRLPGYCAMLEQGTNGAADPVAERVAPSMIRVDAEGGFAPLALARGTPALIGAARETGIAAMGVVNAIHIAALWPEVERLTDAGLVGLACTSSLPIMTPTGGARKLFGTDPIAFGWPREGGAVIFDMATATMAFGEVTVAARDGHALPEGAALDADGQPTTDAAKALDGSILPFGGVKGGLIAMMVELLAGPLLDQPFGFETGDVLAVDAKMPTGGELLLAIDPARLGGPDWAVRAERLFAAIEADGDARLPSRRRYAARKVTPTEGVRINAALMETIRGLAA